jgi:hypothetical protein
MSDEEVRAAIAMLPDYDGPDSPSVGHGGHAVDLDMARLAREEEEARAGGADRPAGARRFGPALGREGGDSPYYGGTGSVVAGGCLVGVLSNLLLGFGLLAVQRAGLTLSGAPVIAVTVALVALVLLLGTWPQRVWAGAGGFVLGLVACFVAIWLFVRPALTSAPDTGAAPPAEFIQPGDAPTR